jgi:hypothetical protein
MSRGDATDTTSGVLYEAMINATRSIVGLSFSSTVATTCAESSRAQSAMAEICGIANP